MISFFLLANIKFGHTVDKNLKMSLTHRSSINAEKGVYKPKDSNLTFFALALYATPIQKLKLSFFYLHAITISIYIAARSCLLQI